MDSIIYHNGCPDGFTAAYIAKKRYPEARLVPRDHGAPIDVQSFVGKDVLCVDINLRGKNDEVAAVAKSFRVLDHHKSELAELDGKPYATFDLNRSGAGLAWDYLFGKDKPESDRPRRFDRTTGKTLGPVEGVLQYDERLWWVDYVEDRDLWRFKLPDSREVNAFIMSHTYSIENWDKITNTDIENTVKAGKFILRQNQKNGYEVAQQAQYGIWNVEGKEYRTAVVNAPYLLASDVGEILYQNPDTDIALIWFERNDGKIQISLRSIKVDVGQIAQTFPGGGGHKQAAGIPPTLEHGRLLIDIILGRITGKSAELGMYRVKK